MAKERKELGKRKHSRVEFYKRGFLIPTPDAPWIECTVLDVGHQGVRLDVGEVPLGDMFGLAFTAGGQVIRVCSLVWRKGEVVGARFLSANELRGGQRPDQSQLVETDSFDVSPATADTKVA
jgi:hypothetical protein